MACKHGHTDSAKMLLEAGANTKIISKTGDSMLHYAVEQNDSNLVKLLISHDAVIDQANNLGITPAMLAAKNGNLEVLELLYQAVQDVTMLTRQDIQGNNCVMHAVQHAHLSIIEFSHRTASNLWQVRYKDGRTCLHLAAKIYTNCRILNSAIQQKKTSTSAISSFHPQKVESIENDLLEFIFSETKNNDLLHSLDKNHETALHIAVRALNVNFVRRLCEHLIDPKKLILQANCIDFSTSAHMACYNDDLELKNLDSAGRKLSCLSNRINRSKKWATTVSALVKSKALQTSSIKEEESQPESNNLCLAIMKHLCEFGGPEILTAIDQNENTILHLAVIRQNMELLRLFFESFTKPDIKPAIDIRNNFQQTPLHIACEHGNVAICQMLIEHDADWNVEGMKKKLAIHIAAQNGHLQCVEFLLKCRPTVRSTSDCQFYASILLVCAEFGSTEVYQFIISQFSQSRIRDVCAYTNQNRQNQLMLAAQSGNVQMVRLILNRDRSLLNAHDAAKNTSLHHAAMSGFHELVEMFLNYGAKITENINLFTPLQLALISGHKDIVKVFLSDKYWRQTMKFRHSNTGLNDLDSIIEYDESSCLRLLDRYITETSENPLDSEYAKIYTIHIIDPGPDDFSRIVSKRYNALSTMARCRRDKLINHPLCKQLMDFKWKRNIGMYVGDLLIYMVFLTLLTYYIFTNDPPSKEDNLDPSTGCKRENSSFYDGKHDSADNKTIGIKIGILVILIIRIILELVKIAFKKLYYFLELENYVYLTAYATSFAFIRNPEELPCLPEWEFAIITSVLVWILFIDKLKNMPIIGIYVLMFKKVTISIVKILVLFSILLIGFAIAFHISLRKRTANTAFQNFGLSFLKVVAMTLGEIDMDAYFIQPTTRFKNAVYFSIGLFMVISCISFMNFMVAIAVGDTNRLLRQVKLELQISQIQMMTSLDERLPLFIQRLLHRCIIIRGTVQSKEEDRIRELENLLIEDLDNNV